MNEKMWSTVTAWSNTHFIIWISELLYCGKVLQDDQALEGYGIKAGVTVYALKKREVEQQDDPKGNSE